MPRARAGFHAGFTDRGRRLAGHVHDRAAWHECRPEIFVLLDPAADGDEDAPPQHLILKRSPEVIAGVDGLDAGSPIRGGDAFSIPVGEERQCVVADRRGGRQVQIRLIGGVVPAKVVAAVVEEVARREDPDFPFEHGRIGRIGHEVGRLLIGRGQ